MSEFDELLDDTIVLIKQFLSKWHQSLNYGETIARIRLPEMPLPNFLGQIQ
jgi:hypothetical protein